MNEAVIIENNFKDLKVGDVIKKEEWL